MSDATVGWPTGTVTFLVTDIEGSTAHCQRLGASYGAFLDDHRALCRSGFESTGGVEVSCPGDGFLVAFASPSAAVSAAVQIQRHMIDHPWPEDAAMRVRIGVHTGEATLTSTGGTYVGLSLHEVARVASAGHGGQVLLSEATYRLVEHQLPPGVDARALGAHRLAGLDGPRKLFQLEGPGLPTGFAPLRTERERRGNLASRTGTLLGRAHEHDELVDMAAAGPLTTVLGPGGMGKTRLAVEVGRSVEGRFADGVWFVDLAPIATETSADDVAASVGRALELDVGRSVALAGALRDKAALLILDNCEHLVDPLAEVVEALLDVAGSVRMVATSRERLGVAGEQILALGPLADAPAVALFHARAAEVVPDFELADDIRGDVQRICARLDGMPLAIELAARRVNVLSPADIFDHLDDRFALLTSGGRGVPDRHRTLHATLDWSFFMLSPDEQRMLARLSTFTGGCTLEAAQAVCGVPPLAPADVLDLVTSLVERSLVRVDRTAGGVRYGLLETVRVYADEHLRQLGEAEEIKRQHLAWCADVAWGVVDGIMGTGVIDLQRLAPEEGNLRAAVEWAREGGDLDDGLRVAIGTALHWWETGGSFLISGRWLEELLERGAGADDPELRFFAHYGVANGAMAIDDDDAMSRHGEEMLTLVERFELSPVLRGTALMMLGYTHREDAARAAAELREAADLQAGGGAAALEAYCRSTLADIALRAGDVDLALAAAEEGLEAARRSGLPIAVARCLTRLAEVEAARNDGPTATARAAEALAVAQAEGATTSIGMALIAMARAAASSGDPVGSGRLLVQAAAQFSQHGYLSPVVRIFATTAEQAIVAAEERSARWALERLDEALSAGVPTDPGSTAALAHLLAIATEHGRDDLIAPIAERMDVVAPG